MKTEAAAKEQAGKQCFSYIRFSSSKQATGDSEKRQAEIAPRIAKEKGWALREDLSIADLGLSAYKKQNLGSLKAIQAAAKSGAIPHGTVMIVEALDRLTRTQLDIAFDLFRNILRSGIEIYVDKGSKHYTKESLNNPIDLIISLVEINAAHDYAAQISNRVGKAWKRKREALAQGTKLTKKVPAWIDAKTWQPIPEKAAVVKRIFNLYAAGNGQPTIVRFLNHDKVPTL
jgi:DNA invertase Pin-like site-specific DNA recombinase